MIPMTMMTTMLMTTKIMVIVMVIIISLSHTVTRVQLCVQAFRPCSEDTQQKKSLPSALGSIPLMPEP